MPTPSPDARNADQIAFWNGPGGKLWSARQVSQDAVLQPVGDLLRDAAALKPGEHVIDVGCGCGATSLDALAAVGASGHVLGLDVSSEMLDRARQRTAPSAPATYVLADATVYPFEPATADVLLSRFGVMFFADPERSFSNMRSALRPGGRLVFACWREGRENLWAMVPLTAAYQHVPRLPKAEPTEPGMFSFGDPTRVRAILNTAGFVDIDTAPRDLFLDLAMGQGLEVAADTALELGPTMRAVKDTTPDLRDKVRETVRAALAPHQTGTTVPLAAAIWIVTARAP